MPATMIVPQTSGSTPNERGSISADHSVPKA